MIRLRRVHALALTVPVLLVGCGSGDVLAGSGTPGSGVASSGLPATTDDPSGSSGSGSAPSTGGGPSSGAAGSVVSLSNLTGTSTSILLDAGFIRALGALRVAPGLVGTARFAAGALVLPVTGGNMTVYSPGAPQPASGSVQHDGGGLTLTAGGTTISLTELRLDVGRAPQLNGTVSANGKVVVRSVTLFDIDDEAVVAAGSTGTARVSGLRLQLDSGLAALLDKSFVTQAFTSGLLLGTATLTLTGR